jgi:hypothetical protein
MCVASFYDFDIGIWNCSDSVVFFGTVPTVWYFMELFRQCGIFCGSVPTVQHTYMTVDFSGLEQTFQTSSVI